MMDADLALLLARSEQAIQDSLRLITDADRLIVQSKRQARLLDHKLLTLIWERAAAQQSENSN